MDLIKSLFSVGISSVINILLSFFTTPIITRIADPTEYGKLTVFNKYVGMASALFYFGFNDALYRFFFECKDEADQRSLLKLCFTIPIKTSIIASLVCIVLFYYNALDLDYSFFILVLLFANVMLTIWNCFSNEVLQNEKKSYVYSISVVVQRLVYCALSIVLLLTFKNDNFESLVIATTFSILVPNIISTYATKHLWKFKGISYPEATKEIIKYSLPMYIYFALYTFYDSIDFFFIEKLCSDYEIGIYSGAVSLIGIFTIVQNAFHIVWRPIQTESYSKNPEDTSLLSKGNAYMTLVMFLFGINIIMFKDILFIFLGESYRQGSNIFPFLVFSPIMYTITTTVTSGIEKSNKSYLRIIIMLISITIYAASAYILIPRIGVIGAAISLSISQITSYLATAMFSKKYYYVNYHISNTLTITLLTMIFAYVNSFTNNVVLNVTLYIICMLSLIILYKTSIKEIIDIIKNLFKKR